MSAEVLNIPAVGSIVIQAEPAVEQHVVPGGLAMGDRVLGLPNRCYMDRPRFVVAVDGPLLVLEDLEPGRATRPGEASGSFSGRRTIVDARRFTFRVLEQRFVEAWLGHRFSGETIPAVPAVGLVQSSDPGLGVWNANQEDRLPGEFPNANRIDGGHRPC